ncbi:MULTISPECIES: ABC transporter substrate-binding protein [unclassified Streptomyces]|uniref:ABC transporter substrate-binding protein n=1 Tax=unclassified Streptomyces TaxID=2593676 RepID=UPI00278C4A4A|nr:MULTISPECIES: ABC transporter substrate-binding protein [unclassified Streptomyces]
MSILRSRTAQATIVAAAVGALTLTGCSSGSGDGDKNVGKSKDDAAAQAKPVVMGTAQDSVGPAKAVPGAKKGGTVQVYQESDFSHLDPGQIYVSDAGLLSKLLYRGLTTYTEDADGQQTVVGDLAKDAGKSSDGGKTWTFQLKDGIKDENGREITSADIRHTIERLYDPFLTDGPTYIQQWLSGGGTTYRKAYGGPYKGKHLPKSVLDTPDDKTIVFHFKEAHTDAPQALAMAAYSVVPEKTDTKQKYDQKPVASGPYKIASYKPGKSLQLVRNDKWDEKTDPMRHNYVDGFNIDFNVSKADQTKTILADRGEAKNAIMFTGQNDATQLQKITTDKKVMKRTVQGYAPYVWQLNMNMDRIKDKKIRDAIALAIPATAAAQADGGKYGGDAANSLTSPALPGYNAKDDVFNREGKPNGDIAKAKKLIDEAGAKGKKMVYGYANTDVRVTQANLIINNLEKIGLDVQKKEIDNATWYEQMGKVKNGLDLYMTGWGQDWADGNTVFPPTYDGTNIQDGGSNYSHVNDKHVNAESARIQKIADPAERAKEYRKLSNYISKEINPAAPIYYTKVFQIAGSNVGGLRYSTVTSYTDPTQVYLKK